MCWFLDGFEQVGDSRVYVKDDLIVMLGTPGDTHDCEEMGCSSAGHIVAYAKGGDPAGKSVSAEGMTEEERATQQIIVDKLTQLIMTCSGKETK